MTEIIVPVDTSAFSDEELRKALEARGYTVSPASLDDMTGKDFDVLATLAEEGVPQVVLRFVEELMVCPFPAREALLALAEWARGYGIRL